MLMLHNIPSHSLGPGPSSDFLTQESQHFRN